MAFLFLSETLTVKNNANTEAKSANPLKFKINKYNNIKINNVFPCGIFCVEINSIKTCRVIKRNIPKIPK